MSKSHTFLNPYRYEATRSDIADIYEAYLSDIADEYGISMGESETIVGGFKDRNR